MEKNLTNLNNNISNLDKMNILNKNKSANINNDSKQDVVLSSSINLLGIYLVISLVLLMIEVKRKYIISNTKCKE